MTECDCTEKYSLHEPHQYGIGVRFSLTWMSLDLQTGHSTPSGHRTLINHFSADSSSANIFAASMSDSPLRQYLPGAFLGKGHLPRY